MTGTPSKDNFISTIIIRVLRNQWSNFLTKNLLNVQYWNTFTFYNILNVTFNKKSYVTNNVKAHWFPSKLKTSREIFNIFSLKKSTLPWIMNNKNNVTRLNVHEIFWAHFCQPWVVKNINLMISIESLLFHVLSELFTIKRLYYFHKLLKTQKIILSYSRNTNFQLFA